MFWAKKKNNEEKKAGQIFFLNNKGVPDREDEKQILAVINNLVDGLLVFDQENRLSLINPKAEKILEVEKKQVTGRKLFELNAFVNFQPLVSVLGTETKGVLKKEVKIKKFVVLELSSMPMMVDQQRIGTLVILRDVTREKLVEAMKSEFVTLAAHQLRTPTSAIKWSLRMMLDGDLGAISGPQKEVIEKAYNTNEKVIHLINDLLDVARLEEGKLLSRMTLVNIEDVIQQVADRYSEDIARKKIKFIFQRSREGLPEVMLDVEKMKIAIDNLIDNAIRYTLPGGRVKVVTAVAGDEIEVQIQDTGMGIPEKDQSKIFSKFFRSEKVMKVETEGTGLGLFIAKNIVELHGGRIWFESVENEGTIFHFTIPIREKFGEFITKEFY